VGAASGKDSAEENRGRKKDYGEASPAEKRNMGWGINSYQMAEAWANVKVSRSFRGEAGGKEGKSNEDHCQDNHGKAS